MGLALLPAMFVPGAWQQLWNWVCRQPCWFLTHGGSCGLRAPSRHVGSRGMAAAVGPGLSAAILVLVTWRELWARGCDRPCWFPGRGRSRSPGAATDHVGSRGMAGALGLGCHRPRLFPGHGGSCGPRAPASLVSSQGMAGALVPRLLGGHVGSQGMAGAVGLGLPPAMLVPGAWRDLWTLGC